MTESDHSSKDVGYDVVLFDPDTDPVELKACAGQWELLTNKPRFVGYWAHPKGPEYDRPYGDWIKLRNPKDFVDEEWDDAERRRVTNYLDAGHPHVGFMGWSACRFGCGARGPEMGDHDLTDGAWIYPQGYSHYLRKHRVKPPEDLLAHIRDRNYVPPLLRPSRWGRLEEEHVDEQRQRLAEVKRKLATGESMSTACFAAPVTGARAYRGGKPVPWRALLLMALGFYLVTLAFDALQLMRDRW